MGLVYTKSDSGLLVASQGVEGAAVANVLREHDRDLRLVYQPNADWGCLAWSVRRYAGPDRPAELVCWWGDTTTGEPYPLSSALVEMVKRLDKNSRLRETGDDERNRQLQERGRRDKEQEDEEFVAWHVKGSKRHFPVHRSTALRMARDRMRARGEKA